jgi:glucoamylase
VLHPVPSRYEIWTLRYPAQRVPRGKILRIILAAQATVVWSIDGGASSNLLDTIHQDKLDLWYADLPTADWAAGSTLSFTFFWKQDQRWEGREWQVKILAT